MRQPLISAYGKWQTREGLLVSLRDEQGRQGLGEVAPIPWFGSEHHVDALRWLQAHAGEIEDPLALVPDELPACRYALECALRGIWGQFVPSRSFPVAASVAVDDSWLQKLQHALAMGYRTFKIKLGAKRPDREWAGLQACLESLPQDARLRIDPNGSWNLARARQVMRQLQPYRDRVDFVEQPLPVGEEARMRELMSEFAVPVALDESVCRLESLQSQIYSGWPGVLVVKPSLAGSREQLVACLREHADKVVFSSALETDIGLHALLQVAAEVGDDSVALGLATSHLFNDNLCQGRIGPTVYTDSLDRARLQEVWESL